MKDKIDYDLEETLLEKLSTLWWRFIKRPIKHFIQRRKRGFDDSELWSLDYTIAEFIYPRLKAFRKMDKMCVPTKFCVENDGIWLKESNKIWNEKLDKMIAAFDLIVNHDKAHDEIWGEINKKYEEKEDKNKKFDIDEWINSINNNPYTDEEWAKIEEGHRKHEKITEEGLKLFAEHFETLCD